MVPATVEYLQALQSDPAGFGLLIGSAVPAGWPEFGESIGFSIDRLRDHPDEADWWMHFSLADDRLVGGVRTVIANTLARDNPSTGVLRRLGFTRTHELVDPEDGPIWRWELPLTGEAEVTPTGLGR
ncbi:N-acetyltransferase [Mycobacterium sp. IDR2000157661]|nr:N-acetyltransferase [Mycobacterium sp. IDR2000157661]